MVKWLHDKNLSFNVSKSKELSLTKKWNGVYAPVGINYAKMEMVESPRLEDVNITGNLSWYNYIDAMIKNAYQCLCLCLLRRLNKFSMSPMADFYQNHPIGMHHSLLWQRFCQRLWDITESCGQSLCNQLPPHQLYLYLKLHWQSRQHNQGPLCSDAFSLFCTPVGQKVQKHEIIHHQIQDQLLSCCYQMLESNSHMLRMNL